MRGSRKKYQSTVGVVNVWGGKIKVAGEIIAFAGASIPSGFLLANGALVSRASYANLFAAIGVTYGAGDGSTTFALPDLRGEFIRGTDNGRGVDSARVNGSAQGHLFASHGHGAEVPSATPMGGGNAQLIMADLTTAAFVGVDPYPVDSVVSYTGGAETRPRNIAMQYLIQY
jgi:microcystin-dependent protein